MMKRSNDEAHEAETSESAVGEIVGDVDPLTAPVGSEFVIQQHHATALHHDFRLEMHNERGPVLVSWAVPKRLPTRRGERHLAIRTPDHSMGHATFSGTIPEDEYGGGVVRIFDHGTYELVDRNDEKLTFRLDGSRLRGVWHLISTGPMNGKEGWLAILSEDNRPTADSWPPSDPMLSASAAEPFDDGAWGFEPRWPGLRVVARCAGGTRLFTAEQREVTEKFPEMSRLHDHVVALDAMVDGVIVAFDDGRPSRSRLDERLDGENRAPVAYLAFDLLYADGTDLTGRPLRERRALLEELLVTTETFQISPVTATSGTALMEAVSTQGLGGIVAKRYESIYAPGTRSEDWLEISRGD
jgi:bifunctional non-homologous end joining protein LigD